VAETLKLPRPFAQQQQFLKAKTRYVAYGGARGGGKSEAVRMKATLLCMNYAGIKVLILRKTFPELRENHISIMQLKLAGVAVYRDHDKSLTFPNGSRIKFGYCDSDADLSQYQGQEYDVVFMDEATHFTEHQFTVIDTSIRGANDFPKRFYLTCNPGGVGHAWVKRLFIDREYRGKENPDNYTFIRSTVYDNKPLLKKDPGYLDSLESLTGDLRRAWLEGDWDLCAGQFFAEFRREIHVCEPFEIPSWWRKYRAIDYGLDMAACLWMAVSDNGEIYVYHEFCEKNLIISEAAKYILEAEDLNCITYAPPDMWGRLQERGKTRAEIFHESGLSLTRAGNDRVQGWAVVREYLKPLSSPDGEGQTARLQIFSDCTELIRCLPLLVTDTKKMGDCLTQPHEITHITDALRYGLVSRLSSSKEPENKNFLQKHKEKILKSLGGKKRIIR